MIKSKEDYKYFLEADRIANALPKKYNLSVRIKHFISPNHIWEFQKTLRKLEYIENCKSGFFATIQKLFLTIKFKKLSLKLGFSIHPNVFGPGLSIAHRGTIVVNGATKIGANCRIHACVNIGTEAGYGNRAPNIGDNCYIGPGAKIYGAINIANGTAIGANAVVNRSVTDEKTAIAGVPAKKISDTNTFDIIIPATLIIDQGLNSKYNIHGMSAKEIKEKYKLVY